MADTDWGGFTDVTSLLATDVLLAARSGAGVNFPASALLFKNPTTNSFMLNAFGGQINLDGEHNALAGGAAYYSGGWRNTVAGQGGWIITNNLGIFSVQTGSNPGAAGSLISTMTERLRIDGSGNLGVGVVPSAPLHVGGEIRSDTSLVTGSNANGWARIVTAGGAAYFQSGSLNSGSASANPIVLGNMYGASGGSAVRPGADNAWTLGNGSFRFSVVYAATGTINTSDAREKAWRGGLSEADIRAGRRIIRELGWYQWLAEIERKGEDSARLHFGVRAQEVIRILIEEGIEIAQEIDLPADQFIPKGERPSFRSAFLCFDTWDDEWQDEYEEGPDGERVATGAQILVRPAGNRFGLRTDQLTLFLLAVQDAVQAQIEARLAALEA